MRRTCDQTQPKQTNFHPRQLAAPPHPLVPHRRHPMGKGRPPTKRKLGDFEGDVRVKDARRAFVAPCDTQPSSSSSGDNYLGAYNAGLELLSHLPGDGARGKKERIYDASVSLLPSDHIGTCTHTIPQERPVECMDSISR